MSPTERGRRAEQYAADYLTADGYHIIARNWRNRWCELDIVARDPHGVVHFVEVKYRATTRYGAAAEYISRDKTARLIRAAAAWAQSHHYEGPYQIGVATVEGSLDSPAVEYLPNAIFA